MDFRFCANARINAENSFVMSIENSMQSTSYSHSKIALIAILLLVYGWISVNIYLPALPFLTHYFHTIPANLKLSITLFLSGFAISQLFWGPISEKYGRRLPLIYGMVITLAGTAITDCNGIVINYINTFGLFI